MPAGLCCTKVLTIGSPSAAHLTEANNLRTQQALPAGFRVASRLVRATTTPQTQPEGAWRLRLRCCSDRSSTRGTDCRTQRSTSQPQAVLPACSQSTALSPSTTAVVVMWRVCHDHCQPLQTFARRCRPRSTSLGWIANRPAVQASLPLQC